MIAALLLAICAFPLDFGLQGRDCEQPHDPCRCSQALQWEHDGDCVTSVNIMRGEAGAEPIEVGEAPMVCVAWRNVAEGEVSDCMIWKPQMWWLAAWDCREPTYTCEFPHEGVEYVYYFQPCNEAGCAGLGEFILYRAPPFACFEGGREVACYEGDLLMRPGPAPAKRSWWRRLFGLPAKER